jgi:hypothetical protein
MDDIDRGGATDGLPFARPIVRQLAKQMFREQSQWRTGELVDRIVQLHRARGGAPVAKPSSTVGRVLQDLRAEGAVAAPGHGWWRWIGAAKSGQQTIGVAPRPLGPHLDPNADLDPNAGRDELIEDSGLATTIRIDKEIGAGSECVYLYFNPNDRRLAELEGREIWECKIGRTSSDDPINRVLRQGIRTALSRLPTVGLVLRTQDSAALENALHSSLRLVGAELPDSPGNEWFRTSPVRVEAWFAGFRNSIEQLGGKHA